MELAGQGRAEEAAELFRQAAEAAPGHAAAQHNLGVALAQLGRADEAESALRRALELRPDYPEACYNLGAVLAESGRRDEALARYERAVALRPGYAEACNNLGLLLSAAGRHEEALPVLQHGARLRPQAPEAHNNAGLALAGLGRFAEAEAAYAEALRLAPDYAEAHANWGSACKEQGRLDEALARYKIALAHKPEAASVRYNRALALLARGDWAEGWREYEWRWERRTMPRRELPGPRWDGAALAGKTVLLYGEQGLGAVVQFVRYAPLVSAGGRVVLECPARLAPLLGSLEGVERVAVEGEPLPPFDCHAPLMSLPGLVGTTPTEVPAAPYLRPQPGRVEAWRRRLAGVPGLKVGVVWQGNPRFEWDRWRSFPLAALEPLARVEGVRLVSLQRGPGEEQVAALRGRFEVLELGDGLDADGAFIDTAAVAACLDLVVSADTAAAHVAGAVGAPVWLALAAVSDWRWLRGRDDTPWYPNHRLFRQDTPVEWAPVFGRMAAELARLAARQPRGAVTAALSPGELLDKASILEIKSERLADEERRGHVRRELAALAAAREEVLGRAAGLALLARALREVNERLWEVEGGLRRCEREGDFGPRFVELARSVYRTNDERGALKRRINELAGSPWQEQKDYGGGA